MWPIGTVERYFTGPTSTDWYKEMCAPVPVYGRHTKLYTYKVVAIYLAGALGVWLLIALVKAFVISAMSIIWRMYSSR